MSAVMTPSNPVQGQMQPNRQLRIGNRSWGLVLPNIHDPRIHLSFVIISVLILGIGWLNFEVSIAQIFVTALTCALIELVFTFRKTSMIIWPASALQTATSIALIFRVIGTGSGNYWSFHGWYLFASVGAIGLMTKYFIRYKNGHIFNPANVALVLAFFFLGSKRVEPLDFWWAPMSWAMIVAYAIILGGGIYIGCRLDLIKMGVAFWITLAIGIGIMSVLGHSITVGWSFSPIIGLHFWWIILTSPEILIFLFFMITDPRTAPMGRVSRIGFGVSVGVLASLLVAPWETEFGAKVGLLTALVIACACRPLFDRYFPSVGSLQDDPSRYFMNLLTGGEHSTKLRHPIRTSIVGMTVISLFGVGVAAANIASRVPQTSTSGNLALDVVADIDPSSLPIVTIDREVAGISASLATSKGAQELAANLAWNLEVEAQALFSGDSTLLPAVDHGDRLRDLQEIINTISNDNSRVVPSYSFNSLHLKVVFPGGVQSGANAGLVATGTVTNTSYSGSGLQLDQSKTPFALTFSLRQLNSKHWLITDTMEE